jgi:hypothetical protein
MMVSKNPQDWRINKLTRSEPPTNDTFKLLSTTFSNVHKRSVIVARERHAAKRIQKAFRKTLIHKRIRNNIETKMMNGFRVRKLYTRLTDCDKCIDLLSVPFEQEHGVCIPCWNRGHRPTRSASNHIWVPPTYVNKGVARFSDGKGGFGIIRADKVPINNGERSPKKGFYKEDNFTYVIENIN